MLTTLLLAPGFLISAIALATSVQKWSLYEKRQEVLRIGEERW